MENRADALDALRGFAIITMILSGTIPFSGLAALPGWMYHAQVPPPDHIFNPGLPGITWVDLVFPFFLFSMGAAFPFALRKRLTTGASQWKILFQVVQRGLLLVLFALFLQHAKPYALSANPEAMHWFIGLIGFGILFLLFYRYPKSVHPRLVLAIKAITIFAALLLFSQLDYAKGSGFLLSRSDIIIIVLANVALFGSVIWLFTRDRLIARLAILAFLLAFRITHGIAGSWTAWVWNATPAAQVYTFYFLQYLFIVIPGTIAGDLYYQWMQSRGENGAGATSSAMAAVLLLCVALVAWSLFGLYTRQLTLNLAGTLLITGAIAFFLKNAESHLLLLLKKLCHWGAFWLLLGLTFEAFEGGIKKDPSTLSYYLVTTGLALFALIAFSIVTEYFKKKKWIQLLIDNGQNPMIAYIAASNLVMPILALTSLGLLLNGLLINPWLGFLKGLIVTLLAALATSFFTRKKIFWRS